MKPLLILTIFLTLTAMTFGPPLIEYWTTPRRTMYAVHAIQNNSITESDTTSNPDSLIMAKVAGWSDKHVGEVKWIVSKIK